MRQVTPHYDMDFVSDLKQWNQQTTDWNLWNHEPMQAFAPYKLIFLAILSPWPTLIYKSSSKDHACVHIYLGVCLLTCRVFFLPHDGSSHLSWPPMSSFHFGDYYAMCSSPILHPSHIQWHLPWAEYWGYLMNRMGKGHALTIQCMKHCQMVTMATNKTKEGDENKPQWTQ